MDLTNHFLVAMPGLDDPLFQRSVIYICEHNEEGAMGLKINTPAGLSIGSMLKQVHDDEQFDHNTRRNLKKPVLNGGPVSEDRGFILHTPQKGYESSIQMTDGLMVTTSKDILDVLGTDNEPNEYIVVLGYAGWEAGQLEAELSDNAWLTIEADTTILFDTPVVQRWHSAIQKLGINVAQLSTQSGHA